MTNETGALHVLFLLKPLKYFFMKFNFIYLWPIYVDYKLKLKVTNGNF